MEINRKQRKELDALSKEVFGTSSRWQKVVDKGYVELLTEEKEVEYPSPTGGENVKNTERVPVLNSFGAKQIKRIYHTVDSIKEYMLEQKKAMDNVRAQIAQIQEQERKKKEQEALISQTLNDAAGRAI
jgi:hypothetical protein